MGHYRAVNTLGTAVAGKVSSSGSGPQIAEAGIQRIEQMFFVGIYVAANAPRHVFIYPPYKNNAFMPVPCDLSNKWNEISVICGQSKIVTWTVWRIGYLFDKR